MTRSPCRCSTAKSILSLVPQAFMQSRRCDFGVVCCVTSVQSDRCEPDGACVICVCHTSVMYQRVYLTHRWPLCLCATRVADRCDDRQTFDKICAWSSGILSLRMRGGVVCTARVLASTRRESRQFSSLNSRAGGRSDGCRFDDGHVGSSGDLTYYQLGS